MYRVMVLVAVPQRDDILQGKVLVGSEGYWTAASSQAFSGLCTIVMPWVYAAQICWGEIKNGFSRITRVLPPYHCPSPKQVPQTDG